MGLSPKSTKINNYDFLFFLQFWGEKQNLMSPNENKLLIIILKNIYIYKSPTANASIQDPSSPVAIY